MSLSEKTDPMSPTLILDGEEDGDTSYSSPLRTDPAVAAAIVSLGASMAAADIDTDTGSVGDEDNRAAAAQIMDTVHSAGEDGNNNTTAPGTFDADNDNNYSAASLEIADTEQKTPVVVLLDEDIESEDNDVAGAAALSETKSQNTSPGAQQMEEPPVVMLETPMNNEPQVELVTEEDQEVETSFSNGKILPPEIPIKQEKPVEIVEEEKPSEIIHSHENMSVPLETPVKKEKSTKPFFEDPANFTTPRSKVTMVETPTKKAPLEKPIAEDLAKRTTTPVDKGMGKMPEPETHIETEEESNTTFGGGVYSEEEDPMPLFKYSRLLGSLPRLPRRLGTSSENISSSNNNTSTNAFTSACMCSAMGKVVLVPEASESSSSVAAAVQTTNAASAPNSNATDASFLRHHDIVAMGFENGEVHVIDMYGNALVPKDQLVLKEWGLSYSTTSQQKEARVVIDVCFDATGSYLAAINRGGTCAIWEFNWAAVTSAASAAAAANSSEESVLRFFTMNGKTEKNNPDSSSGGMLKASSVQVSRITYPASFGAPSVCVIDPSYKKRREKGVMVGFKDGRLIYTKRGFFSRRNDAVIYQGTGGAIQAIAWRGQMLAYVDGTGIKMFDVDSMARVAHVDRPTGARLSLYPALSSLKPSLVFETSDRLLCAWGDCLLCMSIKEQTISAKDSNAAAGAAQGIVKKRHVECTMAWELDCVACGVVPLDKDHVVVLGLVTSEEEEEEDTPEDEPVSLVSSSQSVELEVQVISRAQGSLLHSDSLPLVRIPGSADMREPGVGYTLLSSYATPRMDDAAEAEEESMYQEEDDFDVDMSFTFRSEAPSAFKDPHLKWDTQELSFDDDFDEEKDEAKQEEKETAMAMDETEDTASVDSEDYGFLFRPLKTGPAKNANSKSILPPVLIVQSFSDAVAVRTRDIDDAVAHALSSGKKALALQRGLRYKRERRRYELDDLINEYLGALLKLPENEEGREAPVPEEGISIRRLGLVAQALPILLGGKIPSWVKWISVLADYPGALFVLRDYVPVRDPKLPCKLYEKMLEKMLLEVESMITTNLKNDLESIRLYHQAKDHFLNALVAWGPTHTIREHVKFYQYQDDKQLRQHRLGESEAHPQLAYTVTALERRMNQTAAGYLLPGIPRVLPAVPGSMPILDASDDSLYDIEMVLSGFSSLVPLLLPPEERFSTDGIAPEKTNTLVALEALAKLYIAQSLYKTALKCYLIIGSLHSDLNLSDVKDEAIVLVNSSGETEPSDEERSYYMPVIAIIEYNHLHRCLLEDDFLTSNEPKGESDDGLLPPLVSFILLVGLEAAGEFFVEHCASAVPVAHVRKVSRSATSSATLPINLVANGLRTSSQLLHWFLDLIFKRKPELYVKFTNTFIPPVEIREMHRTHLDLYVQYANEYKDSARFLSTTKASSTAEELTTPLLRFLKALLPLGGVRPEDVRRLLDAKRAGKDGGLVDVLERREGDNAEVKFPQMFALELAFIMEHFGKDDEGEDEDAKKILSLYLEGAESLSQAVFYAQRNTDHSSQLWEILVDHCLNNKSKSRKSGVLFGSLLEAAAQSGADLARLVKEIPQGMPVEGLRPRLVGAVADYRWKLQMHRASAEILSSDKVVLLRELSHRSRRGVRFRRQMLPTNNQNVVDHSKEILEAEGTEKQRDTEDSVSNLQPPSLRRPVERKAPRPLIFSLPVR